MSEHFISTFRRLDAPAARGKYLSRVFGIFSEEIVRAWASDPRAPYEDLGRPTLRMLGERAGSTLDFTLRSRSTGKTYVAELKCEIEYQGYRHLVLTDPDQLKHHTKPAFAALLVAAARDVNQRAYIARREIPIDGAILIWGASTPEGRAAVVNSKGFFDVLTLAEIISDLRAWNSEQYRTLLNERRSWTNELYAAFASNTDV